MTLRTFSVRVCEKRERERKINETALVLYCEGVEDFDRVVCLHVHRKCFNFER